ncbi:MAG TPA: hypothetical protein VIG72_06735, partial [Pontibacter sp.]
MQTEDRKLIERALVLAEFYVRGRLVSRISLSLIGAGISILGFSNVIPYVAVLIRPELSNSIETQNNVFMTIALILIVTGCLIPIFIRVFGYYKSLYVKDIEKINKIYAVYDIDTFDYDMLHITNNQSIFDYQIDRIEEFYNVLLSSDFYFYDTKTNDLVKKFGNELSSFNSAMSLRVSPSGSNPHLYDIPRAVYSQAQLAQVQKEIADDCTKLRNSYREMKSQLDKLQTKRFFRFFA